jgi:hypothetical protein
MEATVAVQLTGALALPYWLIGCVSAAQRSYSPNPERCLNTKLIVPAVLASCVQILWAAAPRWGGASGCAALAPACYAAALTDWHVFFVSALTFGLLAVVRTPDCRTLHACCPGFMCAGTLSCCATVERRQWRCDASTCLLCTFVNNLVHVVYNCFDNFWLFGCLRATQRISPLILSCVCQTRIVCCPVIMCVQVL